MMQHGNKYIAYSRCGNQTTAAVKSGICLGEGLGVFAQNSASVHLTSEHEIVTTAEVKLIK